MHQSYRQAGGRGYLQEGLVDIQHGEVVALGHSKLAMLSGLSGEVREVIFSTFPDIEILTLFALN